MCTAYIALLIVWSFEACTKILHTVAFNNRTLNMYINTIDLLRIITNTMSDVMWSGFFLCRRSFVRSFFVCLFVISSLLLATTGWIGAISE